MNFDKRLQHLYEDYIQQDIQLPRKSSKNPEKKRKQGGYQNIYERKKILKSFMKKHKTMFVII